MQDFQKFELSTPAPQELKQDEVIEVSDMARKRTTRSKSFRSPKSLGIVAGVIGVVLLLSIFTLVLPAYATYKSGLVTYKQAKLFAAAMKNQNVELASTELDKTKVDLADTQKKLNSLIVAKFIPVLNFYYNDADHAMKAGVAGLEAATIAIDSLKPYADVLGLKGSGSFAMGSSQDRIKTAVMTMGKITPKIDDIAKSFETVQTEIDKVNPNHYPAFIFGSKVKTQLTQVRDLTDQGATFIRDARPLIKVLPSLLGEKEDKKYLVLFQNDKELRPTGGFITAYAIFKIDKGQIHVDTSEDIYSLDASIPKPKAPRIIADYLPKVSTFNLRDSNLSPDYIESMKTFQSMYEQSPQAQDVDGIIAIDTYVLTSTIKILDDQVQAGGLTFTTQPDNRCGGCPQVIYQLEDNISRPVNYIKTDRKGLLGQLLQSIMSKALSSSPKLYWGPLFQAAIAQTNQKHVLFYLFDKDAQSGIESLKAAGRIQDFTDKGDYLHINDTNFGGAKSNLFIQQTVENNYKVENDGSIIKTVTIKYKNPQAPSDCNLERGALCLNAENRDLVRIYVPKGSELIREDSKGSQVKITTYDELGKTVIEGFLTIRPLGAASYTVSYRLPFKVSKGSPLPVLIQKQPGTDGNEYTTVVNGRTVETFNLYSDKELKLSL